MVSRCGDVFTVGADSILEIRGGGRFALLIRSSKSDMSLSEICAKQTKSKVVI